MKLSAETQTHERYFKELMQADCPMTKLDAHGDPRLAPFGRILRASGLGRAASNLSTCFSAR